MNVPERPGVSDTPEAWARYFAARASAAVAVGDERMARQYARWSAAEIRFGELIAPIKEEKRT